MCKQENYFMVKVQALSIKVSLGARGNWLTWDFGPFAFTVDASLVKFWRI